MNSRLTKLALYCWAVGCCLVGLLIVRPVNAEPRTVQFATGSWDPSEWIVTKSARFPAAGKWEQADDHIYNRIPADATPEEMLSKRAAETHAALVLKQRVDGDARVSIATSFDHRMAPAILLTQQVHESPKGPEYRNHLQVVLFDQGINVWRGDWNGEKFSWTKAGYARFSLKPKQTYRLHVKKTAKAIEVSVDDGPAFGFASSVLGDTIHVGIIGCEGINRFYDMTIESGAE